MRLVSYLSPGFPAALFEAVGAALGAEVHFERATSGPAPHEDPFADGTYDLGWVCSTSFVDLTTRGPRPSVRLVGVGWVPADPGSGGRPVYFGDLVVRPDTAVASLTDLRGARIACNDVVSLSGHHALRLALEARGEPPDFADLVFTGGHHRSLAALIAGQVDAAVIDSIVRTGRARSDPEVAGLRVVDRLGPWPTQPLVARDDLDPGLVAMVRDTVLDLNDRPDVRAELARAALDRFVAVGDDHCAPVRTAFSRRADRGGARWMRSPARGPT